MSLNRIRPCLTGHNLAVMDTGLLVAGQSVFEKRFQWGHNLAVMDTGSSRSEMPRRWARFNGATTLRSWIQVRHGRRCQEDGRVSMGPQPCGHGYRWCSSWLSMRLLVSMGPQPCGQGYSIVVQVFVHNLAITCAFRNLLSRLSRLAPNFHLHLPYLGSKMCERSTPDRTRNAHPA